jgi:predicted nucleic acid-binding Zn ribbon protein
MMAFSSFKNILSSKAVHDPKMRDLQVAQVFAASKQVLEAIWGPEKAVYASPMSFREGTLKFETSSPSAKQQLQVDLPRLRNEINRQLGRLAVRSITVVAKGF